MKDQRDQQDLYGTLAMFLKSPAFILSYEFLWHSAQPRAAPGAVGIHHLIALLLRGDAAIASASSADARRRGSTTGGASARRRLIGSGSSSAVLTHDNAKSSSRPAAAFAL